MINVENLSKCAPNNKKTLTKADPKMKLKDKRMIIFIALGFLISVAACVLRTVALFRDFDFETGYFGEKTLIFVSTFIIFASVLPALLYFIFGKARKNLIADFHSPAIYIPSGLLALAFIFMARELLLSSAFFVSEAALSQKIILFFILVGSIASILYLFLNTFLGRRYSQIRGAFGFAPIITLLAFAALLYFDTSVPINAPNKSVDQIAYVITAVFFCGEIRISLGREIWRLYTAVGIIAASVCAYSSIPSLIIYFTKDGVCISSSVAESILTFALFVFITAKTVLVAFLKSGEKGMLASSISSPTEQDVEEKAEESTNENQMSIDDILLSQNSPQSEEEK